MEPANSFARSPLLPVRLIWGVIFVVHGLPKLLDATATAQFFGMVGLPWPAVSAVVIGFIEVVCGALLLAGVAVRTAAALLGFVMLGAIGTVKFAQDFVGGWEFDLALLAGLTSLWLTAPAGVRQRM